VQYRVAMVSRNNRFIMTALAKRFHPSTAHAMDYDTLLTLIKEAMPTLAPQLQRAAIMLETRADDVALLSMRELSASVGLNPSTFTRLARTLGFDDYAGLRQVVVDRIRARGHDSFSRQARKYVASSKGKGRDALPGRLHDLHQSIVANIDQAYSDTSLQNIAAAAKMLAGARRVYLVGTRSCVALTMFFQYAARLFSDKVVMHTGLSDACNDGFRYMKKGDVVLALTFDPYTKTTGEALQKASALGAQIILVTDSMLGPNADLAALHLVAPVNTASFFHSLSAPLALLDALLLVWLNKEGKSALTQLEHTDRQLHEDGVYLRSSKLRGGAQT
jgi:DNA-binding MurR/RpiR family transcriptional regulator